MIVYQDSGRYTANLGESPCLCRQSCCYLASVTSVTQVSPVILISRHSSGNYLHTFGTFNRPCGPISIFAADTNMLADVSFA